MCLVTEQNNVKIADKDIVCWKVVEILDGINNSRLHVTPYMFKHITEDVLDGRVSFKSDEYYRHYELYGKFSVINEGYIHTYAVPDNNDIHSDTDNFINVIGGHLEYVNKRETFVFSGMLPNCGTCPFCIGIALFRCVIPAGTEYLQGYDNDDTEFKCYASREIVFKEKLAEWNHKCDFSKEQILKILEKETENICN